MRELKFRAWDRIEEEFAQNIDCLLDISVAERVSALDDEGGELIIEQYTGLKDKNGEEIYEGDILEDGSGEPLEYWVVKFEDGKFIGSTQGVDEDVFELTDLEIIGNIHENPELLGEEEE